MGQIYLTASLEDIPGWAEMGPEPFDLTLEEFRQRLQPYRGEIRDRQIPLLTRRSWRSGWSVDAPVWTPLRFCVRISIA